MTVKDRLRNTHYYNFFEVVLKDMKEEDMGFSRWTCTEDGTELVFFARGQDAVDLNAILDQWEIQR